jgi:hypothetical protein
MVSNTLLFQVLLMVIHVMGMKPVALQMQLNSTDASKLRTAAACGGSYSGSTSGAANVVGNRAGDALYDFSLTSETTVTFNSCGSGFDTWLRVFRDSVSGQEVCGCDDCGNCGWQTILECTLGAGNYVFVVDGWWNREGSFSVSVSCSGAEPAFCGGSFSASTSNAADVVGNPAGDALYDFSLSSETRVTLDSCGSSYDTWLRVFRDSVDGDEVCGCDDCGDCGYQTVLECTLGAGNYVIAADGWWMSEGELALSIACGVHEPAFCGDTLTGSTVGAENHVGSAAGDKLYSFSVGSTTQVTLSSCDSGYDTWLRVFRDSEDGQEVCGCDDCGNCGLQTVLDCSLDAGNYVIAVDGWWTREGSFSVSITC